MVHSQIRRLTTLRPEELVNESKELGAPLALVKLVAQNGKLPVPNFAAGGVATPADAALCMQLGAEAVFVGSGIFKSEQPEKLAHAVVEATANFQDAQVLARCSRGLGPAMRGIDIHSLRPEERLQERGW
jgi:pyridoxal 5'-phosphate synthase pdxS subunit